jgi:hydrogenase-4 transcriptional activator
VTGAGEILGNSDHIRRVLGQIELVAPTDATVLILGETGVGKELVARAIHQHSPRRDQQFVKVNCTAIPRELFESEFFGHLRGAFSGATRDRMGRFQLADGGTLFLDEIGDLPPGMQPKLLRVLQDGEFQRVGEDRTRHANVRIIAASNRDLMNVVRERQFREDLYYRLSVFPIEVPPLRERKEDIAVLAKYFFESACKRFNRSRLVLTEERLQQLLNHDWPGNVRELQNVIDRAVIGARDVSFRFEISDSRVWGNTEGPILENATNPNLEVIPEDQMRRRERENVITALKRSNGKIYGPGGAAELLGIKPNTLSARIQKLKIKKFATSADR